MPIVKCPKCDKDFENTNQWGVKQFCSRPCANSKKHSEETRLKIANSLKKLPKRAAREIEVQALINHKISFTKTQLLLSSDFSILSIDSKKNRVILEQNNKCLICNISSWQNKPIKLAVDHIDGNNKNDARENLRGLCPNCHSQTDTFCGRNKKNSTFGGNRVTDERLLAALLSTESIRAALRSVGRQQNAHNYERCKNLLEKYNMGHLDTEITPLCANCLIPLDGVLEKVGNQFCGRACAGKYLIRLKNQKVEELDLTNEF